MVKKDKTLAQKGEGPRALQRNKLHVEGHLLKQHIVYIYTSCLFVALCRWNVGVTRNRH